jgi:ABC-type transport system involved in multi-copper enzyme maturation permease subunit
MLIAALPMNIGTMLWFLVGFVIIFINFDFESGCIGNPLAIGITRAQYYGAKFVMALLTCFIFVVVTLVAATLPFAVMEGWGDGLDVGAFLASAGVGYLILVAQVTLFMSLAMMLRKIGATLGVLIGYLVLDMVVSGFMAFVELSDVLRGLANVLPSPAAFYLNGLSTGDAYFGEVMWVVVVSVVVIVVMSALAVGSLTRRDI